jgi:N-glycosylase/DNA lyase
VRVISVLPLRGAGGEPISFARTVYSHGCASLPPAVLEPAPIVYKRKFRAAGRVIEVAMHERNGRLIVETASSPGRATARIEAAIARMFRFDADLSQFYARIADDDDLRWAVRGAGRMLASPTVFEDVVKTICTTNCTWSATVRMTTALSALGGGAFPQPQELVTASDAWYRDVAKMGYRGAYVRELARAVASEELDLDALLDPRRFDDAAVEQLLLALPGVGPYAAAHVMQLLGRHRRLVLDSWTRPKFRRLAGMKQAKDSTIRRAFARYGEYAGLAFWLYLTRDWIEE